MARVAPLLIALLAVVGLAWWLFSGSEQEGAAEPSAVIQEAFRGPSPGALEIKLDRGGTPVGSEAGATAVHERAAEPSTRPIEPQAAPTSQEVRVLDAGVAGSAAENALAEWHRAAAADRPAAAGAADPALRKALTDFGALWGAGEATVRDEFRRRPPEALGPVHAALARAYAENGLAGLESALRRTPGRSAARLAWVEFLGYRAVYEQDFAKAGWALGEALRGMTAAGYGRERILELKPSVDAVGDHASAFLPSEEYEVQAGDSLIKIARGFQKQGYRIGFGWIRLFNRRGSSNSIRVGQDLKVPTSALHVEVWRDLRLLALFAGQAPLRLYSVSVGTPEQPSPLGEFTISIHEKNPVWWRENGKPIPFGNPENPLGTRWLGFEEQSQYGIHGTNSEPTIGSFETQGCVRMHNPDVEALYDLLPDGTRVRIHP